MGASVSEQRLLTVAGRIYDAAFDETLWGGLAGEVARTFDAPSTALHVRSAQGDAHLLDVTPNLLLTSKAQQEHAAYWRKNDLWVRRARELGSGRILLSEDMVPAGVFERSAFYQDWCRHQGQFHIVGTVFQLAGGEIGSFGIHRPRDQRPFNETHRRHATTLLQHYRRALEMRRRLADAAIQTAAARQALHYGHVAVLVVGRNRHVLHACGKAEALLRQGDGLHVVAGQLGTRIHAELDRLIRLLDEALAWFGDRIPLSHAAGDAPALGWAVISRPGRLPLSLLVAPLRLPGRPTTAAAALVLLRDPETVTPSRAALMHLFGLTGAEAAVASELARGRSIEAIARAQCVSFNTVRTHVKKVLTKTNTTRQAEAVALILGSSAASEAPGELPISAWEPS